MAACTCIFKLKNVAKTIEVVLQGHPIATTITTTTTITITTTITRYVIMYERRKTPDAGGCRWQEPKKSKQCPLWGWTIFTLEPKAHALEGSKEATGLCIY